MNLTEASILKKYENNIGDGITEAGGNVPYNLHWIPDLDESLNGLNTSSKGDNIFIAEYGVTSARGICAAYDSGYVVLLRATINPFGSYNGNRYYWGDIDDGLNSFLFLKERYSDAIHTGAYFEGYFFGECEEAPYSLYKLIARVDGNEWTYRIDEVVPIATQNEIDSLFTGGGSISS